MLSSPINHIWPSVPTTLIYFGAIGIGVLSVLKDTITAPQPPPVPVVPNISPTKTIPLLPTKTTPVPIVLASHDPSLAPAIALVACAVITAASALVVISKCRSPSPSPAVEHRDDEEEDEEVRESEGDGSDDQDHLDSQEQEDDQDCEAQDTDDESADDPDEDSEAHDIDSESEDDEEADQEADTEANVTEGGAPPPPPDPSAAADHRFPKKPNEALLDWVFSLFAVLASTYILVKSAGALRRLVRRTCDRVLRAFVRLSPQHQLASPPPPPAPSPRLPPPLLKAWREERAYGQETLTSLPPRPSAQLQVPPSPPRFAHPPPIVRPPPSRRSLLEILIGLAIHADVLRLPDGQVFDSLAVCLIVVAFVLPLAQILLAGPTNDRAPVNTPAPAPAQPPQDLTTSCDASEDREEPPQASDKTDTTHLPLACDLIDMDLVVFAWTDDTPLPFSSSPSISWEESPEVSALEEVATCPSPDDITIAAEASGSSLEDDEVGVELPLGFDISAAAIGPSHPSCTSMLAAQDAVTSVPITSSAADWFSDQALPFSVSSSGGREEPLSLSDETATPLSTDADSFEIVIPFQRMDDSRLPFSGKPDEVPEDYLMFDDEQMLSFLWADDSSLPLSGEWDEFPDDGPTQCTSDDGQVLLPVWSDDSSLPFAREWDEPFEDDAIRPLSPDGVAVVVDDVDGERFPEELVESDASIVVLEWQPSHTALSAGPVEDMVAPVPTAVMAELPDNNALPFPEFPWAEPEKLLDDVAYTAPDLTIDTPERVADQILPSSSFLADDWEMLTRLVEESRCEGTSTSGICDFAQNDNVAVLDVGQLQEVTLSSPSDHTPPISLGENAELEDSVEERTDVEGPVSLFDSQCPVPAGLARVASEETGGFVVLPTDPPPRGENIGHPPLSKDDSDIGFQVACEDIAVAGEVLVCSLPEIPEDCADFLAELRSEAIRGIPARKSREHWECGPPARTSFAHLWQRRECVEDVSRDSLEDASILVQGKEDDFEDDNFEESFFADHLADDFGDQHSLLSLLPGKPPHVRNIQRPSTVSSEPGERESYAFLWGPPSPEDPDSCPRDPLDDASLEVLGCESSEGDLSLFFNNSFARDPVNKYFSNKAAGNHGPMTDRPSNHESVMDQASTQDSTELVLEEATSMDITDLLVHVPIGQSLGDVTFSLMPDEDRSGDWEYLAEMQKEWEVGH